jgi:hypothetical protein
LECNSAQLVDLRTRTANVTSQQGENGILSAIFETIGTTNRRCVEFGAYQLRGDSNVYPLWHDEGWDAILIEGDVHRAERLRRDYAMLERRVGRATILAGYVQPSGPDSLDARLAKVGWTGEIDLCVIDVDGMDYHIFRHMEWTQPRVVVCEFNPTIPLHLNIIGSEMGNRLGCSLRALHELGRKKGYSLVACTRINGIFVRDELAGGFAHRDDLEHWFDPFAVSYLMTTYDGSVFLSRPPHFSSNLFSKGAASDLAGSATTVWIPRLALGAGYVGTRLGFEAMSAVAGPVARVTLRALRAVRARFGLSLFGPPTRGE